MIRVMIVDDEKVAIDALRFIIVKNFNNLEIVATARSGREAIEKIDYILPDIIFMDISMPGINGIESIREIKKRHKSVIFIVLTAFDQFDYAKEAINLGVYEYLLKPVSRTKVVEVVRKAMGAIKVEREKRQVELDLKEKLEIVLPILEHGFIYSMIFSRDNHEELLKYKELFQIKENGGYVMTVQFDEGKGTELESNTRQGIGSNGFYPFFRDTLNMLRKCIIGPMILNRIIIFVPCSYTTEQFTPRFEAISLAEQLSSKLSDRIECGFRIGVGRIRSNFKSLSSSYEESLEAIRSLKATGIMYYSDISNRGEPSSCEYPNDEEKLLFQKISIGDYEESVSAFNQIFDWLIKVYRNQPLKVKNKLLEILYLVYHIEWESDIEEGDNESFFLEEILTMEDMEELKLWCKKRIEDVAAQIRLNRENKAGILTKKAKQYIDYNYTESITLEDVSREINVSPQYFSRLFKEETGVNFIDYLTSIRIAAAKDLLSQGNLSVKEICYRIGYGDPNYFSRIFKKVVGVTPTEYKD